MKELLFNNILLLKEKYKAQRIQINNDIVTANKLEFKIEVYVLHEKKQLINQIINDLEDTLIEIQKENE